MNLLNNLYKKISFNNWQPYLLIFIINYFLYFKTLTYKFVYFDDNFLILNNYWFIKNIKNILEIFKQNVFLSQYNSYYRPIFTLSLMLDAQLGGKSPFFYHLSNIIFHTIVCFLIFILLKKIQFEKKIALLFSIIFAIHPIATRIVAWIPGRNDSLLTIFVLLSFIFYINFSKSNKLKDYFFHISFFILAIFTKETAFITIFIIIFYNLFISKENLSSYNKRILFFSWIGSITFWVILRMQAIKYSENIVVLEIIKNFFKYSSVTIIYIGKFFLPFNLSVYPTFRDSSFIFGFFTIILLILIIIISKNKRCNYIFFGVTWFLLFLFPTILISGSYFLEHRVYLSNIGLFFILYELIPLNKINSNKIIFIIPVFLIISGLSIINFRQSNYFISRLIFWKSAVESTPHSCVPHNNLSLAYFDYGLFYLSDLELKKAIEISPDNINVRIFKGISLLSKKMYKEAENEFKAAIRLNPHREIIYYNYAKLCYVEKRYDEAERLWKKTFEVNPNYIDALKVLSIYYLNQNKQKEANYYFNLLRQKTKDNNYKNIEALGKLNNLLLIKAETNR